MPPVARVIPWLVLGFALLSLFLGFHEWSQPPFTDEQLVISRVDTWEVARSTTRVLFVVFLSLGLISVVLARKATDSLTMLVAYGAAVACVITLLVTMRNHIALTQRVSGLTGEEFGALFGLL
jgi:hypothetical protein